MGVLDQLEKLDVSQDTTERLIQSILSNKRLKEISLAAYDVTEGRMDVGKVKGMFEQFLATTETEGSQDKFEFVSDDLEELVSSAIKKHGLRWRLNTLNKMLGSLRRGDFGFIFARPETGKTTFLASEVTFMAEQLSADSGPIIWFKY